MERKNKRYFRKLDTAKVTIWEKDHTDDNPPEMPSPKHIKSSRGYRKRMEHELNKKFIFQSKRKHIYITNMSQKLRQNKLELKIKELKKEIEPIKDE